MSFPWTLPDRWRRLTAGVFVVLYAVLATIGPALAVCEDASGHVAIEWRGAACCADEGAPPPVAATTTEPGRPAASAPAPDTGDDCGVCRDAPATALLTSRSACATRSPTVPSPAELPAPAVTVATVPTWAIRASADAATPRAGPVPPPPLALLRTVVLRC